MVNTTNDSEMDAVLTGIGDVYAAHDHVYLLGSILRSGQDPTETGSVPLWGLNSSHLDFALLVQVA